MINIAEYRKLKGISQKEFAAKLGVSAGNLCEWEKGRIEPSISALIKMAELLEVSVDELVDRDSAVVSTRKSDNQELLLRYFNLLDETKQQIIIDLLKNMI